MFHDIIIFQTYIFIIKKLNITNRKKFVNL